MKKRNKSSVERKIYMSLKDFEKKREKEWQTQYKRDSEKFNQQVSHLTYSYEQACKERNNLLNSNIAKKTISNSSYSLTDEPELFNATYKVQDLERRLFIARAKQKYVRPNKLEDVTYRQHQEKYFQQEVLKIIPNNLLLRFHASPIYFSELIIKTKKIVPSYETYGIKTSADEEGKISVTKADNLHRHTMPFYSGLWEYKESLPAGCIFAVFPKTESELEDEKWFMNKIDFSTNPEQLYKIITTPENINLVKKWCKESGLDTHLVCDYENFLKILQKDVKQKKFTNSVDVQYASERTPEGNNIIENGAKQNRSAYVQMLEAASTSTKHRIGKVNEIIQKIKSSIKGKTKEVEKDDDHTLE